MNLKNFKNKTLLMFGKSRAFSEAEFEVQIKHHNLKIVDEFSDEVELIIEGRMMSPYEQNTSEELYENQKIPSFSIDVLEKELVAFLDADTLLMSLKLSHDKERLKSFIQNSCISDELFFKLIKMYAWSNEDFFENDDNRDVSAAFISRFYENIERNHNVQYATTGFIHLVSQAKTTQLLSAISELQPLKFHPKIMMGIAMSSHCDEKMQKKLHKKRDTMVDEALSCNVHLCKNLINIFLEDENLAKNMARNLDLDEETFVLLLAYKVALAQNESLSVTMQKSLVALKEKAVDFALATNDALAESIVLEMLKREDQDLLVALYINKATPVSVLESAYKDGLYHASLAQNENTPVEILYQLQLDSRYERSVKTNAAFGKHIQSENIGWL